MLLVPQLREHLSEIKAHLSKKNFKDLSLLDDVLTYDDERKSLKTKLDGLNQQINEISKKVGQAIKTEDLSTAELLKTQSNSLKEEISLLNAASKANEEKMESLLAQIPNIPSAKVPEGMTPEDNQVIVQVGNRPNFDFEALPHWDLAKKYKIFDLELGVKLTGAGFPVFTGKGAVLQRALQRYFLDFNIKKDYYEVIPPLMVNRESAFATGQLPDKEGQMYYTQDEFYLIPTAEVPVTNIYRDTILRKEDLPIKLTAFSQCFRREAGSYGKDVRGLNRVHQFDKVEIVHISHPHNSYNELEQMKDHVAELLASLGLEYRVLLLCGGDMSFASAMTYDLEVYSAAQEKWLEVSSVSNFETYQANRLKVRFKNDSGKNELCHTLNGSSLALPRIMAAILENYQTPQGIRIPEVLVPYTGFEVLD
ncbi:MAG: serine--tRNA ligase [Chitinophagales bacterium]|jgi:seryl-tRNA synthetase|nr:serine--tRNA ligase [Chitinophagales bacterium]